MDVLLGYPLFRAGSCAINSSSSDRFHAKFPKRLPSKISGLSLLDTPNGSRLAMSMLTISCLTCRTGLCMLQTAHHTSMNTRSLCPLTPTWLRGLLMRSLWCQMSTLGMTLPAAVSLPPLLPASTVPLACMIGWSVLVRNPHIGTDTQHSRSPPFATQVRSLAIASQTAHEVCIMGMQVVGKAGQQTTMRPILSLFWSHTSSSQRVASTRESPR